MRLKADLLVCDWSVITNFSRNNSKHALITLGRKPSNENSAENGLILNSKIYLMVNTAKDNRFGTTYAVTRNKKGSQTTAISNVEIFDRFVKEGKATIRFTEPSIALLLTNADPVILKTFLSVLKEAHRIPTNSKQFSTLNPMCKRRIEKATTSLTIHERKEYPSKEVGFPYTLEQLSIQQLSLKKVDARIFQLNSLVTLDLSGNVIKEIPNQLTTMPSLKCLNLANNKIKNIPQKFCQHEYLCQQLLQLNLEGNNLMRVPNSLLNFTNMITLNLKNNHFSHLPRGLFQKMVNLSSFDISGCKNLITLPTSFFDTKRMDSLVASNLPKLFSPMDSINYALAFDQNGAIDTTANVPSLLDISCKTIAETKHLKLKSREENVIPIIMKEYMNTLLRCFCRKICVPSSCLIKVLRFQVEDVMKYLARDFITDQPNGIANFEYIFCSHNCYKVFIKSFNLLPN